MFTAPLTAQQASKWRAFAVVFSLVATLLVAATSLVPRAALADTGEAPYGTPTQALQAAMSLGSRHTCVISNGNLLCWGDNTLGQLGNGSFGTSSNTRPTYVVDSQASPTTPLAGVIGVIAATDHSCALINTGKVKCWGYGWKIGKYVSSGAASPYPTFVKDSWINTQAQSDASGDLTGVVGLAASTYNSCALINDGKVKCWGDDTGGGKLYRGTGYVLHCANDTFSVSCGSGSTSNVPISNIKSIVMSAQSACAIKNDANGTQLCWGNTDVFGYTFQGENSKMYASSAHSSVNGSKAFSLGQRTGCGLFEKVAGQAISVSGGQVKCWGMNGSKTLGRGDTLPDNIADRYNADVVPGLDNAIAISGEMDTFCALLIDRTAKCWGNNQPAKTGTGQAGFANGTPLPMRVGSITSDVLTDIYAVSVGADHVCIITGVSGNVKCSGTNTAGQLGDGSVTAKAVMTDVKAVSGDGSLEGAGADKMPPTLASVPPVAVNTAGTKVILSYSELLASSGSIPVGQFVVKVGGVSKTISSATVNGQTVELNMAERITPGAVVRMGYNDPTSGDDTNIIEDASYNDAATISERDITNNSTTEGVAPTLVSAAVDSTGEFLTLTYSEALGTTTALTTAFAVTYGGSSKTPTARSVSGSTVVLTLSPRVQRTDSVTVDYAAPTADLETTNTAVQDAAGNDAASFSATAATNSSTYDTIVPTFVSGAMNGLKTKMILTFSEALSATVPTAGQFRYRVNSGSDITPTTAVTISGSTVEVTLNTAIVDGNTIEFTYTDSSGSNDVAAIQDTAGNDAATISTFTTVANVADTAAPVQQSAVVNAAGTSLTLTYDEELNSTTAPKEAFTVTVGGVSRTVSAASVSGSTVVLTLSPAVQRNEVVAVTYAAPTPSSSGTSNNAVQDSLGNDAASFSSSALVVTNSSTIDTTAPTFVSATVSTGGNILLTYSEALNTTTAPTSRFQVTIAGTAVTVSSVTVSGSVVTIVTTPVVGAGQSVAVTYSAPSSGNTIEDSAGNDAASSGAAWTISGGNNLSTLDLTGPTLVSSAVNTSGAAVLTFSETLGATGPSASAFTVTVDGVTLTVTSVTIVGATVVIVTSPKIEAGKAATIVYNAPSLSSATSNSAIQDATGNDAAGATFTVSSANNASTYDPTPPTQTGSEVNDAGKLVITYSETLATPGPDASQFTVTIDGKTATIVSVEIVDNKIVITTSPLITGGETVTWGYADATTGNDTKGIQDAAGNDVGSGTSGSGSVTNGSKVSNVDPVPPTVTGSQVDDGGKVVISFSETIATPGPDSSQFIVTIDGSPVTIVSVVVVDNKVVITTAPLVAEGQTVTWKYADTTTGNDQKAIQDKSGNDLSSTSGSGSVSNGSKVTKEAAELEEDPSTTMLSDEVTVDGVSGTATFGDGSQIVVSGKNLKIRFKTGYIGNAGGTVTGTYLVGKKKTTYKCTVASFGTEKKNPSAKRIYPSKKMGLWFKKKVYSPKKPCVMPTAMQTALKTQRITLTVKLNFKRLWPNTAKAVDDKGNKIPKSTRIMKLKIGKKPTV